MESVALYTKQQENAEHLRTILESVNADDENPFENMETQFVTQKFINFDINRPTTFVVSSMGSGKSVMLKNLLE